jgi:hypothetical protein
LSDDHNRSAATCRPRPVGHDLWVIVLISGKDSQAAGQRVVQYRFSIDPQATAASYSDRGGRLMRHTHARSNRAAQAVWATLAATLLLSVPGTASDAAELPTWTATYQLEYKGRRAGTSEFSVRFDAATGVYEFQSQTNARGVYRLVRPNTLLERSRFVVDEGRIRPLEFWFEDGSRRGGGNLHIVFDWERGVATVNGSDGRVEFDIEPGVLDRGSMQVALMYDMAHAAAPPRYLLADEDSLRSYEYRPTGEESITTAAGRFETRTYMQQREGSSRATVIWAAPALEHLPVRVERQRNGETETALLLESVRGLNGR